ncbi:MAG: Sulfate transport system permease protein CysT [Fibrobacteres bacterium]|nr:Sulfate transport system permease protein CysT [Fibrobacterota bacterium]
MTEALMTAPAAKAPGKPGRPGRKKRHPSVIPGFGLTLGFTVLYLSLVVLIPLSATFIKASHLTWPQLMDIVTDKQVLYAFRLSFLTAAAAALVNGVFGLLVAWVLVRYKFPGRGFLDSMVDLPFALPTAVAGIALCAVYAETGWIGALLEPIGIRVAYTPLGVIVALIFIGLPFVVRTVQPVLEDLDKEVEEAATSLGASRLQIFVKLILPAVMPSLFTGVSLAFARALGEYGSVIFISGNMPLKTEIVPLIIVSKLEQYDYAGATAVACIMLVLSFSLLLAINLLQKWAGGASRAR